MSQHSKISPSSIQRVALCPGSYQRSMNAPDDTNIYAQRGTAAHSLLEQAINDPGLDLNTLIEWHDKETGITLDVNDIAGVKIGLDYIRTRQQEAE